MARMARGITLDQEGLFHLRGQVAGPKGYYPLQKKENALQLLQFIRQFTLLYFCVVISVEIMGSHYHLTCRFARFRRLSRAELWALAELFYPGAYRPYLSWGEADWERFNRRLFNVSELMRNIQQAFARWFNDRHGRKGAFWAGRFQSADVDNLLETVFYVELNAVRAGLVKLPEQWRYGSAWMRKNHQDEWLMPLTEMLEMADAEAAEKSYWVQLYWRGTQASKETDRLIPEEAARQMEAQQFGRGCYLQYHGFFSRGGKVGSRESVQAELDRRREKGLYKHRRHAIATGVGNLWALREQRSTYRQI